MSERSSEHSSLFLIPDPYSRDIIAWALALSILDTPLRGLPTPSMSVVTCAGVRNEGIVVCLLGTGMSSTGTTL
ncbi:hypothetical protein DCBHLPFO_00707 [Mycoplasmopsis arginini]|uniref:Uncharacterized protein n=1 Tax=Mycoplasmopsis arginini TaxID=2094 RepID=A0AA43QYD1_MYCAR|nr:hypothetical protein [Mycoplasmopsis arginini]